MIEGRDIGAHDLISDLKERGLQVVLASSAPEDELEPGVDTVVVMSGGWSKQELREAGATAIFESVDELREGLDEVGLSRY